MPIDLEFITTSESNDNKYSIKGIPEKLWEVFEAHAKKIMPEKGNKAWASLLTEIIQSHVDGNTYTFIMTNIPKTARDSFATAAKEADLTMDHIIGVLFRCADNKDLHILNMISEDAIEKGYKTVVITGVGKDAWEKWRQVALTVNMYPEELLGHMIEASSYGNVHLEKLPDDPRVNQYQ